MELIPDQVADKYKTGSVIRIIDIKEDGSGSWWYGNYKTRFYRTPGALAKWREKQVIEMPYKDFSHEELLLKALEPFIYDLKNGLIDKRDRMSIEKMEEYNARTD